MKLQALGIDLAKKVFHLVGLDSSGQVVIRKRCSHRQVLGFTANTTAAALASASVANPSTAENLRPIA